MPLPFSARFGIADRGVKDGFLKPPSSWRAPKPSKVASYTVLGFPVAAGYFTVTRASPVRYRLGAGGVLSPTGALVPIRKLFAICNAL